MESAHKIVINHSSLYRECLKNHAAMLGAHATDGCGEFIASPSTVPSDPTSLTCAACGCHRNFHRRVASETPSSSPSNHADYEQETECIEKHMRKKHRHRDPHDDEAAGSHVLLTLKTGGGGGLGHGLAAAAEAGARKGKKRFRSKFSREQKEGMMALAERLRWRLQRRDEDIVEDGCRAIGVERSVFKVWMHNNKQTVLEMKRREEQQQQPQQQQQQNNNNGVNNSKMNGEENKVMNCSSSPPSDRS